ncbi:MAG: superoxide dismutase, Ni [Candidatus Hodarchaeales archaeon]|jgi:nickel superoxide dismutase
MNVGYYLAKLGDKFFGFKSASAHCDIPCGIYDPHLAQLASHTVLRMANLIQQLDSDSKDYGHKLARYTATKEEHAELVKHEIRVLWGDYFKPEHFEKFPELKDLLWKTMLQASKTRQGTEEEDANALLESVQRIAEIFWETKGRKLLRVVSPYPTEREIVLHQ